MQLSTTSKSRPNDGLSMHNTSLRMPNYQSPNTKSCPPYLSGLPRSCTTNMCTCWETCWCCCRRSVTTFEHLTLLPLRRQRLSRTQARSNFRHVMIAGPFLYGAQDFEGVQDSSAVHDSTHWLVFLFFDTNMATHAIRSTKMKNELISDENDAEKAQVV